MHDIVQESLLFRGSNMHAGIGCSIINKYFVPLINHPSIAKRYIRNITHSFYSFGSDQISGRPMGDLPRFFQIGHKHVKHITQPCGCISDSMRQMQPAMIRFNRSRTLPVFYFFDRVIDLLIYDDFVLYFWICNIVA